jgi:DNA-binding PucR family transcriptional regulator
MLRAVSQQLGPSGLDSRVTVLGRSAVGWVVLGDDPSAERVEATAARLRTIHDELRRSWDAAMGIGSLQSGESGLRTTVTEAVDAARVAVNRASAGYRVRVDSLGLDQLLLAWTSNDTFLPAAESLLSPLMHDSQDLLQTLTTYLDQESVVNATAAAMGIHRNTVSMRIHRVQQLLGVDFSDPRTRMALHLACHAVLGD